MKFLAIAAMLLAGPALADDLPDAVVGDPKAEFAMMIYCTASEATIAHLHLQTAATLSALSSEQVVPQINGMMDGYKALSEASKERAMNYIGLVRDVLVPALAQQGVDESMIREKTVELLTHSMSRLATVLSNPDNVLDEQTAMERKLMDQAKNCESLAAQITTHHAL